MYSSYTAATFAREYALADRHGVNLDAALTWAFEFEDQPYFEGQRVLATNGIDLPVLNVFRMFSRMGGQRVETRSSGEVPLDTIIREGVRGAPDVGAIASLQGNKLCVLVWHYHDDDVAGPDARVQLDVAGLPLAAGSARLTHYRIDQTHSNAFTEWKNLGSPAQPDSAQYALLIKAGRLSTLDDAPGAVAVVNGAATLDFILPRQAVSLLVMDW
jgi:xylan 1,4-beta-xylosidase